MSRLHIFLYISLEPDPVKKKNEEKTPDPHSDKWFYFILTNEVILVKIRNSFVKLSCELAESGEKIVIVSGFWSLVFRFSFHPEPLPEPAPQLAREKQNFFRGLGIVICKNLTAKNQ